MKECYEKYLESHRRLTPSDLYFRAVVGWAMSKQMTANLVNDALMMAIWKRKPAEELMLHTYRGSQYASDLYQKTIKDHGSVCSMSRKGSCWDNAPSESFSPHPEGS